LPESDSRLAYKTSQDDNNIIYEYGIIWTACDWLIQYANMQNYANSCKLYKSSDSLHINTNLSSRDIISGNNKKLLKTFAVIQNYDEPSARVADEQMRSEQKSGTSLRRHRRSTYSRRRESHPHQKKFFRMLLEMRTKEVL
jgi:hypothetical protein